MKQRLILNDIAPDFKRDNQQQAGYIEAKKAQTVGFVANYLRTSGAKGIVLGISGGVDSFLVGCLCADACRQEGATLLLLLLPNGEQSDIDDARACAARVCEIYPSAQVEEISIRNGYEGAIADLRASVHFSSEDVYAMGNLQPRLRMMYQYALARQLLVAGTDHATESITGFYTKYGDGGSDINPIQELVKDDIYDMSSAYGAPKVVLEKRPAAGLGISADDESELGIKYADICAYLKGEKIGDAVRDKLEGAYTRSMHKRALPASLKDVYINRPETTIVVVDLIRAFVDGALACENSEKAVINTVALINRHPAWNVLYVRDSHPAGHCSFTENGGIWPAHAVQGTESEEFVQALYTDVKKTVNAPIARYNVFNKGMDAAQEQYSAIDATNSAFGSLQDNLARRVIVTGAATEYCVLETVKDLLAAGFDVVVREDCLAYVDVQGHQDALAEMRVAGVPVR